ncbi:MAG TPA: protein-L-isoaspartate(D-aspartate) O-methyltransferase [Candidatus Dormibacteraeota bacterium]|nr:protein-L-isoaspartate(D-aspartate) O-methyltransferase [Candidatus Dormibacteraeota bacterium]
MASESLPFHRGSAAPSPRELMLRRVREGGVVDPRVLDAMSAVPREEFVTEGFEAAAYDDRALPIGYGQTISQPLMVGLMLQALEIAGGERVLDVGTGSGYQAALLSAMGAGEVVTVERIERLAEVARRRLSRLGYAIAVVTGDGSGGVEGHGSFDAVVCGAVAPAPPRTLLAALAPNGRLVIPLRWLRLAGGDERLVRFRRRDGENGPAYPHDDLGPCRFVPLLGREGYADGG